VPATMSTTRFHEEGPVHDCPNAVPSILQHCVAARCCNWANRPMPNRDQNSHRHQRRRNDLRTIRTWICHTASSHFGFGVASAVLRRNKKRWPRHAIVVVSRPGARQTKDESKAKCAPRIGVSVGRTAPTELCWGM